MRARMNWPIKSFWHSAIVGLIFSRNAVFGHPPPFVASLPLIMNTWAPEKFQQACEAGWQAFKATGNRLDAIEAGATACEELQCDFTVGYGGSPDEDGETTLDALIMDGPGHTMGAVGDLRRIKNAIGVARAVMNYTKHSMLAGEQATQFAVMMGFTETSLQTNQSRTAWATWKSGRCQPNFRKDVLPEANTSCGPYHPKPTPAVLPNHTKQPRKSLFSDRTENSRKTGTVDFDWTEKGQFHDTIGLVAIDANGDIAVGTSTNGASHKVPGRVGDGPIPGAGAYVDNDFGGAAETGDGDVMMRFLPSYQAVEYLRQGLDPMEATAKALMRVRRYYPNFSGALIAANKIGEVGAACNGMKTFSFSLRTALPDRVQVLTVPCLGTAEETASDTASNGSSRRYIFWR